MCKAFSCVVTRAGLVYWKAGLDSHEDIVREFHLKDTDGQLCRVEVTPANGDYLDPDLWVLRVDENERPVWFNEVMEQDCMLACEKWQREVYSKINLEEARHPVYPFQIAPPAKITEEHLALLRQWDSVWDSVGDSVGAYIGSLFPGVATWKYAPAGEGYPYQAAVDLRRLGLVPSFDGTTWRLHGGPQATILWEGVL